MYISEPVADAPGDQTGKPTTNFGEFRGFQSRRVLPLYTGHGFHRQNRESLNSKI